MYEELKAPIGRPESDNTERKDLNGYIISSKFKRQVTSFFDYWDKIVKNKSNGYEIYVSNMENFFGEILDKFEDISSIQQVRLLNSETPFKDLSELTNLKLPNVFPDKQDNKDFIEIFLQHKF